MEKKDLLKKQKLAEELGMKFDEVSELFSEETLCSMQMVKFQGRKGGVNLKVGCDAQIAECTNNCPSTYFICIDIPCPGESGTTEPPLPPPPTPPSTVQQDAICWQTPPPPPETTK